jgi:branched-chain amino acid transport system ATP-binding protein
MLQVEAISAFYDDFQVLHDVSLSVAEGQLVALVGPNGHGKSSLLHVICGLLRPAAGRITFDGQVVSGLPTNRLVELGIVLIPEERHLFPEMTVLENLRLGATNRRARAHEAENLDYVLELFPRLGDLARRRASGLSGGEARMVAVGRGLMSHARFLAIDEPSFGLAPGLRANMLERIGPLRARGITVLLVEQTVGDCAEIADHTYVLEDGRVVFGGAIEAALADGNLRRIFIGDTR